MANIEWRPIQNIPGNPADGFRTFMEGLKNAEAGARGIRQNQLQNTEMALKIMDSISGDIHAAQKSLDRQSENSASSKPVPFNRQELGVAARNHFFSGGTIDDFQYDGFDPTNKDQYTFTSGIFKDSEERVARAMDTAGKALEEERLADIALADSTLTVGSPEHAKRLERIEQEYGARRQNLTATVYEQQFGNYIKQRNNLGLFGSTPNPNVATSVLEARATGSAPSQSTQNTPRVAHHAQSMVAERDAEANTQAGIRDESIAAIEEALAAGQITEEEAAVQIDIANQQYEAVMQAYDDEWKQTVMVGTDGSVYGTDFQYDNDGNIKVGNKTLSPEVSSAIQEAAEISGIPVDMQLAIYGAESGYNPKATSKTGARGLGQLTPPAIKDVIQNYPEELEAAGIPLSEDMDRLDPRTNAIVSSLYMKLQNEKYLGGRNSIEERYIAYNIGAENPFIKDDKFINADPNTPIDRIGFPTASDAVKKNIDVYRKPNGQWRTKNEVYEEIRKRMGIVKATPNPNDPVTTLGRKAANAQAVVGNVETFPELTALEQTESPADVNSKRLTELINTDFLVRPEAFANAAITIAESIIPDPGVVKGESVSNLGADFFKEALTNAGVSDDSKTVARVYKAFSEDHELRRLSSEDVAMVLSFAEEGMWSSNIDMPGLRTNIKKILENRENNRVEYRQFVDDSKALQEVATEIKNDVQAFDKKVKEDLGKLRRYQLDLSKTDNLRQKEILSEAIRDLNDDMDRNKTLHRQKLQELHKEAINRATKIETMNQHLRQVMNRGISNQAEADIKKLEKKKEAQNYRDPLSGQLKTNPRYNSAWDWESNSAVW